MHRHDLIIKINHFVVIACSLNQDIHSLTVRMRFSFCDKGSFDFCGKSKLVRGMDLESSLLLEAFFLDVAVSYCTEWLFES